VRGLGNQEKIEEKNESWERGFCKLADRCDFEEQDYVVWGRYDSYCSGIKYESIFSKNKSILPEADLDDDDKI